MRNFIIFILVILVGIIGLSNLSEAVPQDEEWDMDRYGKVIGQVFDPKTGEPANEQFKIYFFDSLLDRILYVAHSDKKGYFSKRAMPGEYAIFVDPKSEKSKYAFERGPSVMSPAEAKIIKVRKGQITRVAHRTSLAGCLKIILVDETGNKINPAQKFYKDIDIRVSLESEGILASHAGCNLTDGDMLDDGEMLMCTLIPAVYEVKISFDEIGYGDVDFIISVEEEKTAVKEVVINMNATTGIEGYVFDQYGNPYENVRVAVGTGASKTDARGYYKIVAIKEGIFVLDLDNEEGKEFVRFKEYKVEIIKDTIVRKDMVF